ncbi:hypothetical protein BJ165DRAFT_344228 [Panaeolus papilionaceus]|nr:hypothetical protein BJ165DRAFT_344228 [Panaeolus papilionaceus]
MKSDQFLKRTVIVIAKSDNYDSTRLHHLSLATRKIVEEIDSEHTDDVFDEDVNKLAAILRRLAYMTRNLVETEPFQGPMCSSIDRCPPEPTDIASEITIQSAHFAAICMSIVSPVRTLSLWRQGVGEIITPYRLSIPIPNSATVSTRDISDVESSDISDDDEFHSVRSSPSPARSFETLELKTISRHELTDRDYLELKNEVDNLVTLIDSIIEKIEKWKSALRVFDTIWEKLRRDASDLGDYIMGNSLEEQEMAAMTLDQAGVYQGIMDRLDDYTLRLS